MSENKIDHEFTDFPVCPWCGREHTCTVDIDASGGGSIDCEICEKPFNVTIDVHYSYTTKREVDEDASSD